MVVYEREMKNEKLKDFCVLLGLFFAHLLFWLCLWQYVYTGECENNKSGKRRKEFPN